MILSHWRLPEIEGLNAEAEEARDRLLRYMERLEEGRGAPEPLARQHRLVAAAAQAGWLSRRNIAFWAL